MKQPKISLVLIYDSSNNLENCLNSIVKQSFLDFEIICVNNGANDKAEEIVKNFAIRDERIKLISLPLKNELVYAKQIGLGVAGGDFVCFINIFETYNSDFIKNIFIASTTEKMLDVKENHLYRRAFLENDEEITQLVSDTVKAELELSSEIIKKQKQEIKKEFDKFYQNNVETIKNNSYEVICRFNQLEKLFYEKDSQNEQKIQNLLNELNTKNDGAIKQIYEDISRLYEHIAGEINKKGSELNAIYEEISKNYNYTEQLVSEKNEQAMTFASEGKESIWQKLNELEKEIVVRYVNIKRLLDMQIDEIKLKSVTGDFEQADYGKIVSENIDKMYQHLNNTSSTFYQELSNVYKDLNEKLIQKNEENQAIFERKISELRTEFDIKIQNLKQEIMGQ